VANRDNDRNDCERRKFGETYSGDAGNRTEGQEGGGGGTGLAGLERGAKTGEDAIERLRSYIPRYSQVAKLAELDTEFDTIKKLKVVEQ
jgi:hypothetical protein